MSAIQEWYQIGQNCAQIFHIIASQQNVHIHTGQQRADLVKETQCVHVKITKRSICLKFYLKK